jgi:DNA-binding transcriptional MerR regulator
VVDARSPRTAETDETELTSLARIQEVAQETGLTPRAIRYYEEMGLLEPAARSEGAYRLYDGDDLARLRFIKGLREDAGFSLAEIRQLLEDEDARVRLRARFEATADPAERREILLDAMAQVDRQVGSLQGKIERLSTMIDDALARRRRLEARLESVESDGRPPSPERQPAPRRGRTRR